MFNFLRLAMVVIGVLVAQGAVAQDDEGLTRRFLAEAPRAWKRYQEKTVRLTGQYTTIMSKNRAIFLHNRYEIKQNEHCKLLSVDLLHIKQPGEAILFCFNPAYAYTLTKKGKNSAWAIKDVGTDKKQREFIEESRLRAVKQGVDALIRLNSHVDLPALVNHASFKVLGAKALHKDRRELIEIRFDNSHPVKQEPFCPIQKGTILLDPALFWCLRRAQTESIYWPDSVGSDRLEVSLREGPDGFPIPMRVVSSGRTESAKEGLKYEMVTERVYDVAEAHPLPPDDEFKLSAFGLPEPPGAVWPKRSRWYLWFIGIAAVSLIVGFYLVRRSRRPSAAMPASGS